MSKAAYNFDSKIDPRGNWKKLIEGFDLLAKHRAKTSGSFEAMFAPLKAEEINELHFSESQQKRLDKFLKAANKEIGNISTNADGYSRGFLDQLKSGPFWLGASGFMGTASNAGGAIKYIKSALGENSPAGAGFGAMGFIGYTLQNTVDFLSNFVPVSSKNLEVSDSFKGSLRKDLPAFTKAQLKLTDGVADKAKFFKDRQFLVSRIMVLSATATTLIAHFLEGMETGSWKAFTGRAAALGGVSLRMWRGDKDGVGGAFAQGALLSGGGAGLMFDAKNSETGEFNSMQFFVGLGIVINWVMWAVANFLGDDKSTPEYDKISDNINRIALHNLKNVKLLEASSDINRAELVKEMKDAAKILSLHSLHENKSQDEIAFDMAKIIDDHYGLGLTKSEFIKVEIVNSKSNEKIDSKLHQAISILKPDEVVLIKSVVAGKAVMKFNDQIPDILTDSAKRSPNQVKISHDENGYSTVTIGVNILKQIGERLNKLEQGVNQAVIA